MPWLSDYKNNDNQEASEDQLDEQDQLQPWNRRAILGLQQVTMCPTSTGLYSTASLHLPCRSQPAPLLLGVLWPRPAPRSHGQQ